MQNFKCLAPPSVQYVGTKSDLDVQIAIGLGLGLNTKSGICRKARLLKFSKSLNIVVKMMCAKFQVSNYPFYVQYMGN